MDCYYFSINLMVYLPCLKKECNTNLKRNSYLSFLDKDNDDTNQLISLVYTLIIDHLHYNHYLKIHLLCSLE